MGAHGSKEKLHRSASERFVHTQVIERERFGSFGKRVKKEGKRILLIIWMKFWRTGFFTLQEIVKGFAKDHKKPISFQQRSIHLALSQGL